MQQILQACIKESGCGTCAGGKMPTRFLRSMWILASTSIRRGRTLSASARLNFSPQRAHLTGAVLSFTLVLFSCVRIRRSMGWDSSVYEWSATSQYFGSPSFSLTKSSCSCSSVYPYSYRLS